MSYTNEQIIEALKAVVAEAGEDHVYERGNNNDIACAYANADGTPSCIVGHVVNRLNPEEFAAISEFERKNTRSAAVYSAMKQGLFSFTSDQAIALGIAQSRQDEGRTWGYAMSGALAEFEYLERLKGAWQ